MRQCQVQVFSHYLHLILGIPLQVKTTESQEADHETICIDRGGNAMDDGVDTVASPVNECCGANENRVDNAVVHSEYPLCMC